MALRWLSPQVIVNIALRKFGYQISRWPQKGQLTLESALARLRLKSPPITFETVIDVGASDGRWSRKVMKFYPSASYLLIEANIVHEQGLQRFKQQGANVDYIVAAAGPFIGETYFDATDPFGGTAFLEKNAANLVKLPLTTIDAEIGKRKLKPPYLIKLDTHGFEVPILEGAQNTLENANLLIIEVYNFRLEAPDCLLFYEMCNYLANKGFHLLDMIDPLFRPKDEVLWQMDFLFARSDRPEFQSNEYR